MSGRVAVTDVVDREAYRAMLARSNGPGVVFLAGHLATLAATTWLVHLSLGSWWLWPAMALQGVVLVHLFAPLHEATHYTAFASRRVNDVVAWICGLAIILSPTFFRYEHRAHHAHTQDPEQDPELIALPTTLAGYLWYLSTVPYWQGLVHNMVDHARGRFNAVERAFLDDCQRREVAARARWMWAFYGAVAVVSVVVGSTAALTFWLVPRLLGEPWMRVIRMAEHVGLPLVPNFLQNTRTTLVLWPLRVLNWNMAYHTAHHFAPAVPFHRLPMFHGLIEPHVDAIGDGYIEVHGDIVRKVRAHVS
ncbi:MAG: fatty acid desaturase [Pseudomonadota bacterium]